MVVAAEGFIDLPRQVAGLCAELVDGHAEGRQALEVHQQVVDEVLDASVVVTPQDASEGDAVDGAEGMVADECTGLAVGGQAIEALDVNGDTEVIRHSLTEIHAHAILAQITVDVVLMDETFQPTRGHPRNPPRVDTGSLPDDAVYVNLVATQ